MTNDPQYKAGQNVVVWGCWDWPHLVISVSRKHHYGSIYFWEYEIKDPNGVMSKIIEENLIPWKATNRKHWIKEIA